MSLEAIYNERLKLIPVVIDMEDRGVTLSAERLHKQREKYRRESIASARTCLKIAADMEYPLELPKSGNNGSLLEFVFGGDYLHMKPEKYSEKTGAPSLDADTLDFWLMSLDEDTSAYNFLTGLRGKRKRDKACEALATYEKFWLPYYDTQDKKLGALFQKGVGTYDNWRVLHPSFNPVGTDHLRWSSSNPNGQNISSKEDFNLRYCFGPAPGREWWKIDYKSIERRIPVYECGEPKMLEVFESPNSPPYWGSLYLLTASILYPEEMSRHNGHSGQFKSEQPVLYKRAKFFDLAKQYGCGYKKADTLTRIPGSYHMVEGEFPLFTALQKKYLVFANKFGYVETIPDKLVDPSRGYPILASRDNYGRVNPTTPFNYHTSGTAMQTTNAAMPLCYDEIQSWRRKNFDAFITLQVHDEMVFDFPRGDTRLANLPKARRLKQLMESCGERIGVPTPCSMELHTESWATGESYD